MLGNKCIFGKTVGSLEAGAEAAAVTVDTSWSGGTSEECLSPLAEQEDENDEDLLLSSLLLLGSSVVFVFLLVPTAARGGGGAGSTVFLTRFIGSTSVSVTISETVAAISLFDFPFFVATVFVGSLTIGSGGFAIIGDNDVVVVAAADDDSDDEFPRKIMQTRTNFIKAFLITLLSLLFASPLYTTSNNLFSSGIVLTTFEL